MHYVFGQMTSYDIYVYTFVYNAYAWIKELVHHAVVGPEIRILWDKFFNCYDWDVAVTNNVSKIRTV